MDHTKEPVTENTPATPATATISESANATMPNADQATFMERVVDDARATGRTASLIMTIRNLESRSANQHRQLDAVWLAIGRNAEEQCEWLAAQHEAGRDDPATLTARKLLAIKEAQTQARAHITERDQEVNAARDHLALEEEKHAEIIKRLEQAYRVKQEELKNRQDNVTKARAEIAAIQGNLKKLQVRIEKGYQSDTDEEPIEQLTAQKLELETSLAEPTARLEIANEKRVIAKRVVDSRNAELKTAKTNWRNLRAALTGDIKTAQTAQERAVAQLKQIETDLTRTRVAHGKALFECNELPESCAELAGQARKGLQLIGEINAECGRKRKALRREKGGAKRFVILACIVLADFILGIIIGYAMPKPRFLEPQHIIPATKDDNFSEVRFLLDSGANANLRDRDGRTPLHWAANRGGIGLVKLLLDSGADVNARDNDKLTPLHAAARKDRREAAKLLLERGADLNAKDKSGKTPQATATELNFTEFAELLQQHEKTTTSKTSDNQSPARITDTAIPVPKSYNAQ